MLYGSFMMIELQGPQDQPLEYIIYYCCEQSQVFDHRYPFSLVVQLIFSQPRSHLFQAWQCRVQKVIELYHY